jgi:hypothetical protein
MENSLLLFVSSLRVTWLAGGKRGNVGGHAWGSSAAPVCPEGMLSRVSLPGLFGRLERHTFAI